MAQEREDILPKGATRQLAALLLAFSLLPGAGGTALFVSTSRVAEKIDALTARLDRFEGAGFSTRVDKLEELVRVQGNEIAALRAAGRDQK